jgi:phosphatidate cytidylyltransferase
MLRTRLLTVATIFPLFLLALFYLPNSYWSALILVFMVTAAHEWARLFDISHARSIAFAVVTLLIAAGLCVGGSDVLIPSAVTIQAVCVVATLFWVVVAPYLLKNRVQVSAGVPVLLLGWVVLIPLWAALVELRRFGPLYVFFAMGVIWLADTAAYFSGRAFGKRKLAPDISPGKTLEGALGALAVAALYAVILVSLGQRFGTMSLAGMPMMIVGFVVIVVLSIVGDLFESWFKRQCGKKDSGSLFPGHGGILDRIDSLTSTMPVVVLALMCCKSIWGIL